MDKEPLTIWQAARTKGHSRREFLRSCGILAAALGLDAGQARALVQAMDTKPDSTCAIGDQVFTDMLGANRLGLTTILVTPLSRRESPHTRLIRLLEAPLRRRWARRQREAASPHAKGG